MIPSHTPTFGERVPGVAYTIRPSAYALISNADGDLAAVRAPLGLYLPGGGIDPGETAEEAVVREALEECGLVIRAGSSVASAVQLLYSTSERTHFEKVSTFFAAEIIAPRTAPTELDHELLWLAPDEAARLLTAESHRWAVREWMEGGGN